MNLMLYTKHIKDAINIFKTDFFHNSNFNFVIQKERLFILIYNAFYNKKFKVWKLIYW